MVAFSLCIEWLSREPVEFFTNEKFVKSAVDHVLCCHVPFENYYIIHQGRYVSSTEEIIENGLYHTVPRILGGKGGFGSMLRALGAQIEKTTNREACRDLSGRRMRDVNNEKQLREWAAKAADREKEKQERRREKREKMLAPKKFREEDKEFELQRQQIADDLDEAFEQGLKNAAAASSSSSSAAGCSSSVFVPSTSTSDSRKRKAVPTATEVDPKKAKPWLQMDDDASSTSDESGNDEPSMPATDEQTNGSDGNEVANETASEQTDNPESEQIRTSEEAKIQDTPLSAPDYTQLGQSLDLDRYDSAEDLSSLGLDILKAALTARGMKCGGTLKERSERLFAVKGIDMDKIPASLLAKPSKKK